MAVIGDTITVEWSPASTPFATSPTWVDITGSVRSIGISRGRTGSLDLFGAGSATITLNNRAAAFDPTAWHRWRQVRITATATGPVSNVLFRGFVETISHDQSLAPREAIAHMRAIDLMGVVARYEFRSDDTEGIGNYLFLEQLSGARVDRILTTIGVPSAWKSVDTGYVDVVPPPNGVHNALQYIQDVVESEAGSFYATAAGVLMFEDRYEALDRLGSAAVTVFSDTPTGAEVPFKYGDLMLTPPGLDYRNLVTITPDSGTPQESSDITAGYPPDSLSRSLPIASDTAAGVLANFLLEAYSQTAVVWPEHVSVSVWPSDQNALDEITALDLREYCQVEFTPAAKAQQTYKVFVESIEHSISPSHWSARIGFSSADRWFNAWGVKSDYLIIGDATYGLIGTGKIGPH